MSLSTGNNFQNLTEDKIIKELKYLGDLPNDDSLSNKA